MKNKIGIIISIILIIAFIIFIDYDYAKKKGKKPIFTIKIENNKKEQENIYIGMFYKTFECYAEEKNFIFSNLGVKKVNCPKSYKLKNGYFTNSIGTKIKEEQFHQINQLYSSIINEMTEKEVEEAYYIANEYNSRFFKIKDGSAFIYNDKTYSLGNFQTFTKDGFKINEDKDYCVELGNENKLVLYEYENQECKRKVDMTPTEKYCKLLKNKKYYNEILNEGC